jgi:RNA polymerase sigma factor for flagellar operon FliA
VKRIALKFREHLPAHVEVDDLAGNGVVGLVDAISKFDTSKRVKLETYAQYRVRGAILDGLRAADPATRDLRRKSKKFQKLYRELEIKVRRPVQDEEMSAASGMNLPQWRRALNEIQSVGLDCVARVLSAGPTFARQSTDPELLVDGSDSPFCLCYRQEQREILARAFSLLRERERQIISLRYEGDMTMKQIAELMHVDESRISQLHAGAMLRLKASVDSLLHPQSAEVSESGAHSTAPSAGA